MTNSFRQKAARQVIPQGAGDTSGQSNGLRAIEEIATVVRLKRGDKIDLGRDRAKLVYAVRSGFLILQADLSTERHVAIALYSPGNIVRPAELPPVRSLAALATAPCQILRMGEVAFDRLCEQSAEVRLYCARETALQSACDKSHIVLLAGLSGEERVASFFVEMAYRMGRRHGSIVTVEIPFSRSDIASFLALNPDTLSRIFSRLKSLGLVKTAGRRSIEILDLQGLAKMFPADLARDFDLDINRPPLGLLADEKQ
ncbi:MAG: Crp/Fnr family transcriptional regulator [Hyphomicrobiaceae bacterium]